VVAVHEDHRVVARVNSFLHLPKTLIVTGDYGTSTATLAFSPKVDLCS
jgi:hypothetical protein